MAAFDAAAAALVDACVTVRDAAVAAPVVRSLAAVAAPRARSLAPAMAILSPSIWRGGALRLAATHSCARGSGSYETAARASRLHSKYGPVRSRFGRIQVLGAELDADARPRSTTAKAETISAALNNIGDLWDEFGQYTSGGRLSGMPPGDAR